MEVKSREIVFRPSNLEAANRINSGQNEQVEEKEKGVWQDIFEDDKLVHRQSHIPMSSPGSILLVLQAILPYLLFSNCSSMKGQNVPLRIIIEGGTNVGFLF